MHVTCVCSVSCWRGKDRSQQGARVPTTHCRLPGAGGLALPRVRHALGISCASRSSPDICSSGWQHNSGRLPLFLYTGEQETRGVCTSTLATRRIHQYSSFIPFCRLVAFVVANPRTRQPAICLLSTSGGTNSDLCCYCHNVKAHRRTIRFWHIDLRCPWNEKSTRISPSSLICNTDYIMDSGHASLSESAASH
jgi:hypothetical protein